jgi:hypothetical protein
LLSIKDNDGIAPVGPEFQVHTVTQGEQIHPSVTALAGGGFVVTWTSYNAPDYPSGIYAQRYNATGSKVGTASLVTDNTYDASSVTALADGGFFVAWYNENSGVFGQRYNAAGSAVGIPLNISTDSPSSVTTTSLANGELILTWDSYTIDSEYVYDYDSGEEYEIATVQVQSSAQRYSSTGQAIGSAITLNSFTLNNLSGNQISNAPKTQVVGLSNGGFIAIVQTYTQNSEDSYSAQDLISGQRYDANGNFVGQFDIFSYSAYLSNSFGYIYLGLAEKVIPKKS